MKTFKEFLEEAQSSQKVADRALKLIKIHQNNPDKLKMYLGLFKKAKKRVEEKDNPFEDKINYPEREAARRDKYKIPSHRTDSFPQEAGKLEITKNAKKLRKQKATGEFSTR
jgi:hypothetical protein